MSKQDQYEEASLALESGVAAVEKIIRDRDVETHIAQLRLERITGLLDSYVYKRSPELQGEPSAHDDACEADWDSEGQESPCRCAERAQGKPSDALEGMTAEKEKWRIRCAEETAAWVDATKRADAAEARWRAAEDECRAVQARLDALLAEPQGEPTDAQLIEARADFRNDPDSDGLTLGEAFNTGWFAALRAAGGAR